LVNTIDELKKKNVGFKVLTGQGAQIDSTTSEGKFMFGMFASLAEFERDIIVERTKAGLNAARARGRLGGRPRKMDVTMLKMAMSAMEDEKSIAMEVARHLSITTTTLYAYINGDGTPKELGVRLLEKCDESG
jgi:DNA invertase Pin-like site-specific DNA recombinase